MLTIRTAACLAFILVSAGCLANPGASFPQNNSPNSSTNSSTNGTNGSSTNGVDGCADCRVGETRCDEDSFMECRPQTVDDEEGGCNVWTQADACTGAQICDDDQGCECSTDCELDGEIDCQQNGAFICAVVDECPRLIQIDRTADCSAPDHGDLDCEDNPDDPLCAECSNGRGCVKVCDTGDYYACGPM